MEPPHRPNGFGWAIIAVLSSLTSVATLTFALRIYVQLRILKRIGAWEDYFAAAGWLLFVANVGLSSAATFYGLGKSLYPTPPPGLWLVLELTYFQISTSILANMAIKQSITIMLLRYTVENHHKKLVYLATCCLQFFSMILLCSLIFHCQPINFYWTQAKGATGGRCMDYTSSINLTYGYTAALILYDLTMAILPWLMVQKLQLNLRTKLMVTAILAFGSITFVVAIVRVPYIMELRHTNDVFRLNAILSIISSCETGLSIATACAATLKPLFRRRPSQNTPRAVAQAPEPDTIPTTIDGSCSTAISKQVDLEFVTSFYGTNDTIA